MTTVVISQPMYFPWPGFMELAATADTYVHLDDVQFSKGGFTNRIQVKHAKGPVWMTVPLAGKGTFQEIRQLATVGDDWKLSHRALLAQSFQGARFAKPALDVFDRVVAHARLFDILTASIEEPVRALGLAQPRDWHMASQLNVQGTSWQRVLAIVKKLGGTRYVTAHGAANYLDHEAFEVAGVAVEYIDYSKTPWLQGHGTFTPYVSILDLLANEGDRSAQCIRPTTIPWRDFISTRTQS